MRITLLLISTVVLAAPAAAQTSNWIDPAGGTWNDANNWSPVGVPNGAGAFPGIDLAGAFTVDMDLDVLMNQFSMLGADATLLVQNRTVTMNGAGNIGPGTTTNLQFRGSVWDGSGQLRNQARIEVRGASRFENLLQDGVLDIVGSPTSGTATLTLSNPTVNNGTLQLDSTGGGWFSTLDLPAGSRLDNFGTVEFKTGTGGTRTVNGNFRNLGTTTAGESVTMNVGPVEQLAGVFDIRPTHTATLGGGVDFLMQGGLLDVQGAMAMTDGEFAFTGGDVSGVPRLRNGLLDIAPGAGAGIFDLIGVTTFDGNLTATQEVRVIGTPQAGSAVSTFAGPATNAGIIQMNSEGGGWTSTIAMGPGITLTNDNQFTILPGTGGARTVDGAVLNQGDLQVSANTNFNTGPFVNRGTWTVDASRTATIQSGTTFTQESGTVDLQGAWLHPSGDFRLDGGSFGGAPELRNGTITFGPGFGSTFTPRLTGAVSLASDVPGGTTLKVEGVATAGQAVLTPAGDTALVGDMDLTSDGGGWTATWAGSGTLLTIDGTMRTLPGTGGARTVSGDLANPGAISVETNTTFNLGDIDSSGSFGVAGGATATFSGATGFTLSGGTMTIDGTFTKDGGTASFLGGTVTGTAELRNLALDFDTGGFTAPADLLLRGAIALGSDVPAATTLTLRGAASAGSHVTDVAAPQTLFGTTVLDSEAGGWNSTLNAPAGSSIVQAGTLRTEPGSGGARTISGDFTNSGSLEANTNTTLSTGTFTNQGSMTVAPGTTTTVTGRDFVQQSGSLDAQGTFTQDGGSATFVGGAVTGVPELRNVALTFDAAFVEPVELLLRGTTTFTGTTVFGQEMIVRGSPTAGAAVLNALSGLTLGGLITMDSEGGGWFSTLNTSGAPLTVTDSGRIRAESGSGGTRTVTAPLTNAGTVAAIGTTITFNGGGFTDNLEGGIVRGDGAMNLSGGTLQNAGIIEPGDGIGTLDLTGDIAFTPTAQLKVQIGGPTASTEHDVFDVSGAATVDGDVMILLENGYVPVFGDQFTVMTAASISGTFKRARLAGGGSLAYGFGFDVVHTPTSVIVQVVQKIQQAGGSLTAVPVSLDPPVPGQAGQVNTFQINGVTGNQQVDLVYGFATGTSPIAGCPFDWGIASVTLAGSAVASPQGRALFNLPIPGSAAGATAYFQALDVGACRISEVLTVTFP